jgi:hypothetical protein
LIFNLTRNIKTDLEPQECITILEDGAVRPKHFPGLFGYYFRSYKSLHGFELRMSFMKGFLRVWGNIKKEGRETNILLKMYPPLWLYFLVCLGCSFFPIITPSPDMVVVVWIVFCTLYAISNVYRIKKVFMRIEKTIENHSRQ